MEESKDFSSNFASPIKRLTPAIPIPIWKNEGLQVKLNLLQYLSFTSCFHTHHIQIVFKHLLISANGH